MAEEKFFETTNAEMARLAEKFPSDFADYDEDDDNDR